MNVVNRIGFLSGDYLDFGGVETHLLSIFRFLRDTEYQSVLIAPASGNFIRQAELLNVQYIPWNPGKSHRVQIISSLVRILGKSQVSILHIHSPGVAIEGRIAALLTRVPAIVTVHLQSKDYFLHHTPTQKLKQILFSLGNCVTNYLLTEKIIYVSSRAYEQDLKLNYFPKKRSVVIPNGVELSVSGRIDEEVSIRNQLGVIPGCVVLCFSGRLEAQKGIDTLIESLGMITDRANVELWVLGAGTLRQELAFLGHSSSLKARVRFLGYQENISPYLVESDVFILPSRYEAMSLALLEAMVHGLPCIATNTGENSRLIRHGVNGFIVPVDDSHAMAKSIEIMLDNPLLRKSMGRASQEISQAYPVADMVEKVLCVYREVL